MSGVVKGITGTVGSVISPVTNLLGTSKGTSSGTSSTTQQRDLAPLTQEELARQRNIDAAISQGLGQVDSAAAENLAGQSELNKAFRDILLKLSTGSLSPSQEQINEASTFVDEVFTKPANIALERSIQDFQGAQQGQAAALGRQPDDIGFQEELLGNIVRGQQDIQSQRAGLIQQRADELSFNRPTQLAGALGQGAQFFNQSATNLLNNRINLLNAGTAQQQLGQRERELKAGVTQTGNTTGKSTQTGSILDTVSQLGNIGSSIAQLGS